MPIRISANRIDLQDARLEQAMLKDHGEKVVSVTSTATTTLDVSQGNTFNLLHNTDITTLSITNLPASGVTCSITIIRRKDTTFTARNITWPTNFFWPGGTAPTLTQTQDIVDIITAYTTNAGATWVASIAGQNLVVTIPSSLVAGGRNPYGQLGDGTQTSRSTPTQIDAASSWIQVSGGGRHSAALKNDGTIWTWGWNGRGQLGDGTSSDRSSPVQVGTLNSWKQISAGGFHTLALRTDGTLWAWGANHDYTGVSPYGQVGDGTIVDRSSPVQIGTDKTWAQVSGGYNHSAAIKSDGTLWTWGHNEPLGYLGDGTTINRSSPVQIGTLGTWTTVSAGASATFAFQNNNSLWAWGDNQVGQVGDGTTVVGRSSPVQITGSSWVGVSAGAYHSSALRSDGSLWVWGSNQYGQLGDGTTTNKSSPIAFASGTSWVAVGKTYWHTVAIKSNGTLWRCGLNGDGELGDGTTVNRSSPVQIGSDTTWQQVAGGDKHFLAIKS